MEKRSTYYDSPERTTQEVINEIAARISSKSLVFSMLEGFPELAVILDKNRQIVAANSKALFGFNRTKLEEIMGKRIGEAISCIHSNEMGKETCGTSKFCAECGTAHAIRLSKKNKANREEECRITSELNEKEDAHNFKVFASPLEIDGNDYTIYAITDISGEKRREALERIFFHDVLNTASVVNNFALLLEDADDDEFDEILPPLIDSSDQLIQEILTQRDLRNAENGNLLVLDEPFSVNELMRKVHCQYLRHPLAEGKKLTLVECEDDIKINSDKRLISRSLGNLVKNAIEASVKNDKVKIYCIYNETKVTLSVYNPMVIPEATQLQIFKRSFSTKEGSGRGIGTYSVKLLIEKYLGGEVFFTSDKLNRTIFNIMLPRN